METYKMEYMTPIGLIEIVGDEHAIQSILFVDREETNDVANRELPDVMHQCQRELEDYFKGTRLTFTFPVEQEGTPFQLEVWEALTTIPYGETTSYLALATTVGRPKAVRAVGRTNGRNRLSIVVPCHRVIGSNGALTGYAGGVERKEWLLRHEKQHAQRTL